MATTTYGSADALTNKLWARGLNVEALKATEIAPLIGDGKDSIIQRRPETQKTAGDQVTVGLRMQLTGDGVTEGATLEGNEESLTTYSDSLVINELRHAVRVKAEGSVDQQRVNFNMRTEARSALRDWFAKRMSVSFFNQVCGYTPQTNTKYTGLNSVVAPSSGRHIWAAAGAGESNTSDANLEADDIFDLRLIDYAKELATTEVSGRPPIRPVMVGGRAKFVVYLHPRQVTDLRTNTSTGQWMDITKAIYTGKAGSNPIYTGALGEYNDCVLRVADDVTQGVAADGSALANVRRAVLLGAQSATIATGQKYGGDTPYTWAEESFDYGHELGVSAGSCFGIKKMRFNSIDFGTVVISTYAAAHG
jgi:N4-gp56 family major capsid protein